MVFLAPGRLWDDNLSPMLGFDQTHSSYQTFAQGSAVWSIELSASLRVQAGGRTFSAAEWDLSQ